MKTESGYGVKLVSSACRALEGFDREANFNLLPLNHRSRTACDSIDLTEPTRFHYLHGCSEPLLLAAPTISYHPDPHHVLKSPVLGLDENFVRHEGRRCHRKGCDYR